MFSLRLAPLHKGTNTCAVNDVVSSSEASQLKCTLQQDLLLPSHRHICRLGSSKEEDVLGTSQVFLHDLSVELSPMCEHDVSCYQVMKLRLHGTWFEGLCKMARGPFRSHPEVIAFGCSTPYGSEDAEGDNAPKLARCMSRCAPRTAVISLPCLQQQGTRAPTEDTNNNLPSQMAEVGLCSHFQRSIRSPVCTGRQAF